MEVFNIIKEETRSPVFLNIIGNAVKFTPNGGSIEIATANPTDTHLTITITDSGIGMSEEVTTRLFRRFEQGDLALGRKDRGLGLGLSIAKALCTPESLQSRARVRPKRGVPGSVFCLKNIQTALPLRAASAT